jgi:hypothetical protein
MTEVPVGSRILVGAPRVPLDPHVATIVRQAIMKVKEICEAHVPQILIEGTMEKPAKVVVIVVEAEQALVESVRVLMENLAGQLSAREYLDILPVTASNPLVESVRRSNTQIYRRDERREAPLG